MGLKKKNGTKEEGEKIRLPNDKTGILHVEGKRDYL